MIFVRTNKEKNSKPIDEAFYSFISEHHVLTLCNITKDNLPWVCNCFYAYSKEDNFFVFKSKKDTKHYNDLLSNSNVSFSMVLETTMVGKIQGLQALGQCLLSEGKDRELAKKIYEDAYPFSKLEDGDFFVIIPSFYKLTDNRLGFGKKLIWEKEL